LKLNVENPPRAFSSRLLNISLQLFSLHPLEGWSRPFRKSLHRPLSADEISRIGKILPIVLAFLRAWGVSIQIFPRSSLLRLACTRVA
jgi:hypothetical protein